MYIAIKITLPAIGRYAQQAIESAVETLARVDFAYLASHPNTPLLRDSGIKYQREGAVSIENWQSIPEMLASGAADCEDLAAWAIAEMRRDGIKAAPYVTPVAGMPGKWHIRVRIKLRNGQWAITDPSKEAGM